MVDFLNVIGLLLQSLRSPGIVFFVTGGLFGSVYPDMQFPKRFSKFLSLYLMMAIGLKGGIGLASIDHFTQQLVGLLLVAIAVSFLLPFVAYGLLRATTQLDQPTAGALAAHYGSVSIITFITAENFLKAQAVPYAAYLIALLAAMEAPAILSGIYLASIPTTQKQSISWKDVLKTNECFLLLVGSLLFGFLIGDVAALKLLLGFSFQVVLCMFLFDMGLQVAHQLEHIKEFTLNLILFGLYMPIIGSLLGLSIAYAFGLDLGSGLMMMVLCASASYIAVPAAMRLAVPEAKFAIYIPMALAVTFPFNVIVGIPLYFSIAQLFLR